MLSAHCFDEFREVARGDVVSIGEFAAYEGVRYPSVRFPQAVSFRRACGDFVPPLFCGFTELTGVGGSNGGAQAGCEVCL